MKRSVLLLVATLGCGSSTDPEVDAPANLALPPLNAPLDYQLGGAYPPPSGVGIVSRDRQAAPASGIYNLCYVNGFQIQPGEESTWAEPVDLVLRDSGGNPIIDPEWGGSFTSALDGAFSIAYTSLRLGQARAAGSGFGTSPSA